VINHAITELGIHTYLNPFNKLRIKGAGSTAGDRKSLTETDVVAVRDAIPGQHRRQNRVGELIGVFATTLELHLARCFR